MLSFLIERQWRVQAYKGGGVGWGDTKYELDPTKWSCYSYRVVKYVAGGVSMF